LDWPLGQVAARTAAGSGVETVPGTEARAAPTPGVIGTCRDGPSARSGTETGEEPLIGLAETGAEALNDPLPGVGCAETGAEAL
jgi:hypothetical protein